MLSNLSGIFSSISQVLRYAEVKNNMNLEHGQDIFALAFIQMVLHRVISVMLLLFLYSCPARNAMICPCNQKYFQIHSQDISISIEKEILKGGGYIQRLHISVKTKALNWIIAQNFKEMLIFAVNVIPNKGWVKTSCKNVSSCYFPMKNKGGQSVWAQSQAF